ncbi:hypothetical protein ACLB2K_061407 [Fragaria x ananassa]
MEIDKKEVDVLIPVVAAVVWDSPPSNELGLVESEGGVEEIIPMKRLKMDWDTYVPKSLSLAASKEGLLSNTEMSGETVA